ncbi:hypothetical protein AMIS_25340 [Actinoplanes missouriensis 431]|uniref:Uncharacterized protein n=1 Tax=Actinoplanes missouriensis (strain ATCC 14538 / DSM 43046 / CBS 188.64 / JCM 3121 / NBRC 102363 / NCIMB 12654 / NRRL B-3342 / UNCC 431) TaxID=512565 RepID=I0H417_ACTM4|nr:hypothetical protein [Actinoplanes missouriensis]BAL87754.1 hypothetical protein AMIS_25340 [Actinoplanes missouriensis 431]
MVDSADRALIGTSAGTATTAPPVTLRGSWVNRPPLGEPQSGTFLLAHQGHGRWLLEQPIGIPLLAGDTTTVTSAGAGPVDESLGWVQHPAGLIVAPAAWFDPAEAEVLEFPGLEYVAARPCVPLAVNYSRHSSRRMLLWLDQEWGLILAARSDDAEPRDHPRFELRVTEVRAPARALI